MALTKEEVAEAVRAWCHAWHTRDVQSILAMEARAVGFGFRPCVWRDHVTRGEAQDRQALERFFGQLEVYSLALQEHPAVNLRLAPSEAFSNGWKDRKT